MLATGSRPCVKPGCIRSEVSPRVGRRAFPGALRCSRGTRISQNIKACVWEVGVGRGGARRGSLLDTSQACENAATAAEHCRRVDAAGRGTSPSRAGSHPFMSGHAQCHRVQTHAGKSFFDLPRDPRRVFTPTHSSSPPCSDAYKGPRLVCLHFLPCARL